MPFRARERVFGGTEAGPIGYLFLVENIQHSTHNDYEDEHRPKV